MTGTDPFASARDAYREAREAIAQYRLQDARAHVSRALTQLGEAEGGEEERFELGIRIRVTGSWLTSDSDGLTAALQEVAAARDEATAAGRDDLRAVALVQAGVLRARAGFVEEALEELRPAVEFSQHLPVEDRVRLLLNKGTMASEAGHLAEAAADLAAAAALATDLPDHAFMAVHNLGFVEYLQGDLPAALHSMRVADEMDTPVDRSVSRLDRARVLMEVGLLDDAAELLAGTVEDMRAAGMADELTSALLDRARCELLRGSTGAAVELADEVVARAEERGEQLRVLAAAGVRVEALLADGEQDLRTVAEADRLVTAAGRAGMELIADRAEAVRVIASSRLGAVTLAPGTRSALRRLAGSPYFTTRLLAGRAELALTDDEERRSELLAEATRDLARSKSGMASLDLRTAVTVHVEPILALDLERAVAGGDAAVALEVTERWRAALDTVPSVRPSPDPEVAGLWSRLRKRHEDLREAPAEAVRGLQDDVAALEQQLRERSWRGPGDRSGREPDRAGLPAPTSATLLTYFWASEELHLLHVPPGEGPSLLRLGGRAELTELVARAVADAAALAHAPQGPLGAAVRSSLEEELAELDSVLLPPELGDGPVVVVPSGRLARLPWGMLPRLRDRGLTLARSAALWRSGATALAEVPRVAVASGPELALAEQETSRVVGSWSGATRVPGEPASVRAALREHDVVHVAAHGRHRADNPLFSSLWLHGGSLFAHELEGMDVRSSLVVLSACGVGRARLRSGDEALGLTSSLLALGVRAVVAPLTDVPDSLACETMAALHRGLAGGMSGPEALAEASGGDLLARSFTWFGSDWTAPVSTPTT
ncbi:CHAT domain-containing protein [Tessaracoccus terricola]